MQFISSGFQSWQQISPLGSFENSWSPGHTPGQWNQDLWVCAQGIDSFFKATQLVRRANLKTTVLEAPVYLLISFVNLGLALL